MRYVEEEEQVSETPKEIQRHKVASQVKSFLSGGGKIEAIPSGISALHDYRAPGHKQSGAMTRRIAQYDRDCAEILKYIQDNPGVDVTNIVEKFGFQRQKVLAILSAHEARIEKEAIKFKGKIIRKLYISKLYPRGNKNG